MFNVNLNIAYCGFWFSGNYLMIKLLVFWMSGIHVMVKERCLYWIIQWWKHLCILKYCKWSAWKIYMTMILITCSWEGNICSFFLQPLLIIHSAWVYKPVCFTKKHLRLDIFRIKPNCNICVPVLVNTIIILPITHLLPDLDINLTLVIQPSFTWCWHQFHSFYSTICFLTLTSILFLLILLIFYLVYQYMYSYMYIFHFNSLFFDFLIFVC